MILACCELARQLLLAFASAGGTGLRRGNKKDTPGAILPQTDTMTLSGVIIPVEWDEYGNHSAIALAADDEGLYYISPGNCNGRTLAQLLRSRVMIEGRPLDESGTAVHAIVKVAAYRVMEDNLD